MVLIPRVRERACTRTRGPHDIFLAYDFAQSGGQSRRNNSRRCARSVAVDRVSAISTAPSAVSMVTSPTLGSSLSTAKCHSAPKCVTPHRTYPIIGLRPATAASFVPLDGAGNRNCAGKSIWPTALDQAIGGRGAMIGLAYHLLRAPARACAGARTRTHARAA